MKTKLLSMTLLALTLSATPALTITNVAHAALAIDFSSLVEQVSDGVVRINVTKRVSDKELELAHQVQVLKQFFGDSLSVPDIPTVEYSYGTGFFVTADGYILTNHHVVERAKQITITLKDRSELDAVLVGSDEASDIAVLKVKGGEFPALYVAKEDKLKVGEPVLALARHLALITQHRQELYPPNLVTLVARRLCLLSKRTLHSIQAILGGHYLTKRVKWLVSILAFLVAQVGIWGCHFLSLYRPRWIFMSKSKTQAKSLVCIWVCHYKTLTVIWQKPTN